MRKKYYVTTPIYYASGDLTIGHCYCSVLSDAVARFYRLNDYDVFFLTGSDEHGLKISRKAQEAGLSNQEFVDKIVEKFKFVFDKLKISYDKFIRTTDEQHVKLVEKVYNKLLESDDIYLSKYEGLYCVPCETFFSESQLVDGKCPDCGRPVEMFSEESYFLKISKYQNFIDNYFKENPNFLTPENRKNEMVNNFIKPGLTDLCVSRTNFDWGVKLPFNKKHVAYVWIDALLNYVSALGYGTENDELFKKYWPCDVHFVGRDIARFHALIWPILLHILNIPLPKKIHSTGFLTLKGDKISKSKSNGFNPVSLVDRYGVDALRYYLIKLGPINYDTPYASDVFINLINSDLCNDLGNLVSRTCAMTTQYFNSVVPQPNQIFDEDKNLIDKCNSLLVEMTKDLEEERVDVAIDRIFSIVRDSNKYIDLTTPWVLNKTEEGKTRLQTVMYVLNETLRIVAVALKPFLVELSNKILVKLGQNTECDFNTIKEFSLTNYGQKVNKGEPLFKRLNIEEELKFLDAVKNEKVQPEIKQNITFDDFEKLEMKVGKVVKCEKVEGSDKLLKSEIQIGNETRVIVSGIAKHYDVAQMVGKNVIVVTNLVPRKIRGILSEGMILCAYNNDDSNLSVLTTDKEIDNGVDVG